MPRIFSDARGNDLNKEMLSILKKHKVLPIIRKKIEYGQLLNENYIVKFNNQFETGPNIIVDEDQTEQFIKTHYNFKEAESSSLHNNKLLRRIMIEIMDIDHLSRTDSNIRFAWSPEKFLFLKFIVGSENEPYYGGMFEFHAYFPVDYPNIVPEVVIHTTDNGKVRFNPNLYANGKVCLSLLGTWSGQSQSERWIPPNSEGTGSTLYQIIMSIYSMIFTEYPWYNEPGRESRKDAVSNKYSVEYNKEIQDATIKYAILNQLKHPEEGFEDVIKEHFILKKDKIISYLKELNKEKEQKIFEKYF
jgi:baculoviral IAP repeat-containing protein 6